MKKNKLGKMRIIKMISIILIVVLLAGYGSSSIFGDIFSEEVIQQAQGQITFLDKPLIINNSLYFVTGRLFVPLVDTIYAIGGKITTTDDGYSLQWQNISYNIMSSEDEFLCKQLEYVDDKPYIYIYDLAQICNLAVVFNSKENKASLYYRTIKAPEKSDKKMDKAYLRLEDVSADLGIGGNFTDDGLEKLRVMADYLWSKSQSFYIAWIPLYMNPPKQIQNDLTTNFNFYNAHFLYTMDYIIKHNGDIAIHGYTHQDGDTVSAIGTEFGQTTPFTLGEIDNRMIHAKEIAQTLGFSDNIFEFPHYGFTKKQLKIAEKHFDIICQQYPYVRQFGYVEQVHKLHGSVTYIPTPLGYVPSFEDLDDTLSKIENLDPKQYKGIFIHPYMDFVKINCTTSDNGFRNYSYDESGIIPQLVQKITEVGSAFSVID